MSSGKTVKKENPLNIIFFGNSFTYYAGAVNGGLPFLLKEIVKAAKSHPVPNTQMTTVGGWSWKNHVESENSLDTIAEPAEFVPLKGFRWDVAVYQNHSLAALDAAIAGDNDTFLTSLEALDARVRKHSPDAKALLYQTWPRAATHAFFKDAAFGIDEFQEQNRRNYQRAADFMNKKSKSKLFSIVPAGDAWKKMEFASSLYDKDLYHGSAKGMLLNALLFYRALYGGMTAGIDIRELALCTLLSEEEVAGLQRVADSMKIETIST